MITPSVNITRMGECSVIVTKNSTNCFGAQEIADYRFYVFATGYSDHDIRVDYKVLSGKFPLLNAKEKAKNRADFRTEITRIV